MHFRFIWAWGIVVGSLTFPLHAAAPFGRYFTATCNIESATGDEIEADIFNTIHSLRPDHRLP